MHPPLWEPSLALGRDRLNNAKKNFCANDVIPAYENYYKRILSES
jgi:hypothetical protein